MDLTWTTTNTISCSASGDWNGTKTLSGSENLVLSDVKTYTFTLTCRGEDPQNTTSKSIDVEVSSINGSDIYSEDKASYCKDPLNDSSDYWLENFDSDVLGADTPVLVDFWAVWCGPCKAIAPIVEEIANDYDGKVKVGKMDVDNNNQVAMKYGIRSIPTLLLFKNGEVVDQVIGNVGKDSIESMLSKAL